MELTCPHCEAVVAEPEQLGENRKSWGSGREICKACTKEFEWKRKAMIIYESTKVEIKETSTSLSAEVSGSCTIIS